MLFFNLNDRIIAVRYIDPIRPVPIYLQHAAKRSVFVKSHQGDFKTELLVYIALY